MARSRPRRPRLGRRLAPLVVAALTLLEQLEGDVGSGLIITLAPQTVDTQST
jgi:hypothetical protein